MRLSERAGGFGDITDGMVAAIPVDPVPGAFRVHGPQRGNSFVRFGEPHTGEKSHDPLLKSTGIAIPPRRDPLRAWRGANAGDHVLRAHGRCAGGKHENRQNEMPLHGKPALHQARGPVNSTLTMSFAIAPRGSNTPEHSL